MKKVCVLLSTYNGKSYLKEQIESVFSQLGSEVYLFARDDGSNDGTQEILQFYVGNKFSWYQGENIGPARSYLELLNNAPVADYYAFCDQDDVWLNDKLSRSVDCLKDNIKPGIYFSNVNVANTNLTEFSISSIKCNESNLAELLLHNHAIGCTVVINNTLKEYINRYIPQRIFMHDWWVYEVCLAIGGYVVFDEEAKILYRQHDSNCVGFNITNINLPQIKKLKEKPIHEMCLLSEELIKGYENLMSSENIEIIHKFTTYYVSFKNRVNLILDKRFFSDNLKSNCIDKIRILFGRI